MERLRIKDIIKRIQQGQTFEATSIDRSFEIRINRYVPYCCLAIHDGHNLRPELREKIAIDNYGRWYEEDPHTGKFIESMPITITGMDSRYEYDLNRNPEEAIFTEAWGKLVWNKKLSPKDIHTSRAKHHNFYRVVYALIEKLKERFDTCVVYDIHSYNYQRWDRPVPLFNVGTERIDKGRFQPYVENWLEELSGIEIKGIVNESKENDVFYGRGYALEYISSNFPDVLVLATEVKKVYCNELSGEDYPKIIRELQQKLKRAILNNAQLFSQKETNWKSKSVAQLLDKNHDPAVDSIDRKLFRLLRNFELLAYVNPNNSASAYKIFKKKKFSEPPVFRYAPIKVNPFELKQELSTLQTKSITDISIRNLYESTIGSFYDKIDLLGSLDTKKFLYNSLRYFGRPSKKDLANAQYIMHLPALPTEPVNVPFLSSEEVLSSFQQALEKYEIQAKIELSNKVISQVMVLNSKRTVLINPSAKFTERQVKALIEHEIGVHMVTTQNSNLQELKLFNLGLPVNTLTQEGLAILSEYVSGNISLARLRKLAVRVIVVDMMCNGADFIECFNYTLNLGFSNQEAFTIVTRIFRGGGFTKDYLYLSGFVKILKMWELDMDLSPLLVGKTSLEFYDTLSEMIQREMISKPKYITHSIQKPEQNNNPIYEYIISGLN